MSQKKRNLDRDKLDFGNGRIGLLFRKLFFPTLVGMLFNSALTVIDGIFVGQGVGAEGIAAVNIVAPLYMVIIGIALMLGIGASVVASIRLSENNAKAANIILTQAFLSGLIIVAPVALSCLFIPEKIVGLLGCTPLLESNAVDYLVWLVPCFFFLFFQCVGLMLIRLDGSPKYVMWVQVIAAVLNIVLDWYYIFPLGMGVKGAAIATSIAGIVGGLLVLGYFFFFSSTLHFYRLRMTLTSLLLSVRNVGYMMKIGFAMFLTEIAVCVMMVTGNYTFAAMYGESGVAAFAIACYLFPLVFSINNSVAQSAQPIISFNYGAHNPGRVGAALKMSVSTALICGCSAAILVAAGAGLITRSFLSPDEPAYTLAVKGLPLFALSSPFFALNIAFIGYYQSIEKALAPTIYTLLRGVIFLVPCFLLLPRLLGGTGLWLAIPAAELLTFAVIATRYFISR